jgi:hypothetical protein
VRLFALLWFGPAAAAAQVFERPVSYSHENTWHAVGGAGASFASVWPFSAGAIDARGATYAEAGLGAAPVERGELCVRVRGGAAFGASGPAPLVALLLGWRAHAGEELKSYFAVDLYGPLLPEPAFGLRAGGGVLWDAPSWGLYAEAAAFAALGARAQAGADLSVGIQFRWPR